MEVRTSDRWHFVWVSQGKNGLQNCWQPLQKISQVVLASEKFSHLDLAGVKFSHLDLADAKFSHLTFCPVKCSIFPLIWNSPVFDHQKIKLSHNKIKLK